ncbi:hypothetical protein EJ03DRAFT_8619 [Teratosphaeria nubilosa]|uniref:Uncharacterized protein n=1 Tax=Teratosphaeria nubilosa TaxID=161662 RepID=A0A6G1LP00_9PEZI|nr:hypothetical protein EJ03DRAFT_8619 [Teratosphaeria nubilosa]
MRMAANNIPNLPQPGPVAANPAARTSRATPAAPSATPVHPPAYTQPFVHYPHILHRAATNQYIELKCPDCGANARSDPPYDFFAQPEAIARHRGWMHKKQAGHVWDHQHKILSESEIKKIFAGEAQDIVKRRTYTNGGSAREMPEAYVLDQYPTVVKSDGKYFQLACHLFGATSRTDRDGDVRHQVWFQGLRGMSRHIELSHVDVAREDSALVLENCGIEITEERLEQLKKDMTCSLIQKYAGDASKQSKGKTNGHLAVGAPKLL